MQDKVSKVDTRNISNISVWLQNKLGSSQNGRFHCWQWKSTQVTWDSCLLTILDLWINGGSSICSQLNKEVLRNIKEVFTDLQTQVKLKLLLSFFHIPRRLIDEVGLAKFVASSEGTHSRVTNTYKRGYKSLTHRSQTAFYTLILPKRTKRWILIRYSLCLYRFSGKPSWMKFSKWLHRIQNYGCLCYQSRWKLCPHLDR